MKRNIFLVFVFFLFACAIFHKQILGAVARVLLKKEFDCELAYGSIRWEGDELVFSDLVLFDPAFHAHIERVGLLFDWSAFPKKMKGHLDVKRPLVSVIKKRTLPEMKESWFDFTISAEEGVVEWDGLAYFSLDHTPSETHFTLDWGDSGVVATLSEGKVEAELRRFKASHFKPFFRLGEIEGGFLSGRVQAGLNQNLISANLKMEQFAMAAPLAKVEGVEGAFSYNANLGAKWELKGTGFAQNETIPFLCQGRGFFKSHWVEAEMQLANALCKVSGEEGWKIECHELQAAQATLLQAFAGNFCPELHSFAFLKGTLNGKGGFRNDQWDVQFEGKDLSLRKGDLYVACSSALGNLSQSGGKVEVKGDHFAVKGEGIWTNWKADVSLLSGRFLLQGGWDGEKFPVRVEEGRYKDFQFVGQGWIDSRFDLAFDLNGDWTVLQKKIPIHCPHLSKRGHNWSFDFRVARKMWDLARIAGTINEEGMAFDPKCHVLGAPLQMKSDAFAVVDAKLTLPWKLLLASVPFLQEYGLDLSLLPPLGDTEVALHYAADSTKFSLQCPSLPCQFQAEQVAEGWKIDLISDLCLSGTLQNEGKVMGKGSWKKAVSAEFAGTVTPFFHCEAALSRVWCDLSQIHFHNMEGIVEGEGHLIYDNGLESSLDFTASALKIQGQPMENEGRIHLAYSSAKGALFQGVNLHNGPLHCAVDLLEYDAIRSHWLFHRANVHLPGSLLTRLSLPFLDPRHDLNFMADLDFASDFSTFLCTMPEGIIPFGDAPRPVKDLHLFWQDNECKAALHYLDCLYRLSFKLGEKMEGRLVVGEEESPLTIDWEYGDHLAIRSIEGAFEGIEASFHAEDPNTLIGSARLNFTVVSQLLPPDVAQVFQEIKMGRGYELKGRLQLDRYRPHFKGILAGKQLELFGFQFRTLLAQVDLGPEQVRITDVKISDRAGVMKIDEIHIEAKNGQPWTIAIPQLTMIDLRPSLLVHPGEEPGPISPLVVRELKMIDFKGLLDEGKTYTAKGKLHFINSYKREDSLLEIPANVLSRIVGIDLDLLIPVCGDLTFDLKDGFFHLLELTNAYSEGERSEFFLETDPPATMDLDGNLNIFIKMKQFVLLKLTESFLISIDGKLHDPQFRLQKKRFFGLLKGDSVASQ